MNVSAFPPGPGGLPIIGNFFSFRRNRLEFLTNLAREYGDIAHFKMGTIHCFLLNHPDYIQDVLVNHYDKFVKGIALQRSKYVLGDGLLTSEGEYHRRQRRIILPSFHRKRIASYADVMRDFSVKKSNSWENGATLDMAQEMTQLSMEIVTKSLFGSSIESEWQDILNAFTIFMNVSMDTIWVNYLNSKIVDKLPIPSLNRLKAASKRLDRTIYRIIDESRKDSTIQDNLLSTLLHTRDEDGDGSGMTDSQVRDEVMTIFLAGHETVANALTWTLYALSQNPDKEQQLHDELDNVLRGKPPDYDELNQLKYTRAVLAESMRLYPPVWTVGRRNIHDYKIDRYVIPAWSYFFMSPFVTQRDPRFFSGPLRFEPERWLSETQSTYSNRAYFPFGGGPRHCAGEQFAWTEGIIALSTLAQHWQFRLVPGHPVEFQTLISLRPKYGMLMKLEKR